MKALLDTNAYIWIAAHAMEAGAHLLSFDGHFGAVEGLLWTRFR